MKKSFLLSSLTLLVLSVFSQGPYAPPAGQPGTTAIHKDFIRFVFWATGCTITRGFQDISNAGLGNTTVGTNASVIGKSGINGVVSLGDGGSAILTFNAPIINGAGADFAVFENSFSDDFLELAFVEVSSDGINFFRFDAISLTDTSVQTGSFGSTDATNLYNLAGKYRAQYGTPFDLDELAGTVGLDINNITHIKIIDVIGNINPLYATYDSQNRIVNDPWPTAFGSSGFDLDAVGIINSSATAINELNSNTLLNLYPNPVKDVLNIELDKKEEYKYSIFNFNGKKVIEGRFNNANYQIDLNNLKSGIYFLRLSSNKTIITKKVIKQ